MAQPNGLVDDYGILMQCEKILPSDRHRLKLLEALAELENNECHARREFPKTRLHKIVGIEEAVYRADIDKTFWLATPPAVWGARQEAVPEGCHRRSEARRRG